MAYTQYGQIAHRIRERNSEVRFNMADRLGLTYEELSGIEAGYKKVTPELIQKLVEEYKIDPEEEQEIREAANASDDWLKVINELVKQKKALAQSEG